MLQNDVKIISQRNRWERMRERELAQCAAKWTSQLCYRNRPRTCVLTGISWLYRDIVDAACPSGEPASPPPPKHSRGCRHSSNIPTRVTNKRHPIRWRKLGIAELQSCTYTYTSVDFRELNPKPETTLGAWETQPVLSGYTKQDTPTLLQPFKVLLRMGRNLRRTVYTLVLISRKGFLLVQPLIHFTLRREFSSEVLSSHSFGNCTWRLLTTHSDTFLPALHCPHWEELQVNSETVLTASVV
jgi:hypothetical protein